MQLSSRFHAPRVWRSALTGGAFWVGMCGVANTGAAQVGMSATPTSAKPAPSSTFVNYQPYACSFIAERRESKVPYKLTPTWYNRWPGSAAVQAAADSAVRTPVKATAHAEVTACLEPFTLETTAPNQLLGLGTAWLSINEDAKAEAAFARATQNMLKATPKELAATLRGIVKIYAAAPRIAAAQRYMARLDSMGAVATGERVTAHNLLFDAAVLMDSVPMMKDQAEIALRLGHAIEGPEQVTWLQQIARSAAHQGHYLIRIGNPSEAEALLTQALAELQPLGWVALTEIELDLAVSKVCQQAMPPIQASFVYLPGDTALRTSLPAQKGRVTVYVMIRGLRIDGGHNVANFEFARDVAATYGSQVDIVYLNETTGWAPGGEGRSKIAGKDEAAQMRDFVHGFMKSAYPLAVWDRLSTGKLADGRLIFPQNPNLFNWQEPVTIVDKKGQIRFVRPNTRPWDTALIPIASGGPTQQWEKYEYGGQRRWLKVIGELVNEK